MCGATLNQPLLSRADQLPRQWKRRSADVGGLHLATGNSGQGKGWVGTEVETKYAELLSDMYNQTLNSVNEHNANFVPTSLPKPTRSRLIRSLDLWHFEPHKLPEEEVLACTLILFEALYRIEGMQEATGVSMRQISSFIYHLRQIYRYENTYHNFEHALDVLQATQCYLNAANLVPPVTVLLESGRMWKSTRRPNDNSLIGTLGLCDLFTLYIAAIGHDVGHPGFSNVFMKNAQTPLSIVFDGRSALEQLHCQLLLRVMRYHGLGRLLDDPVEGHHFRKLLLNTVLATDMGVHAEFMERFQDEVDGRTTSPLCLRQILISQALLKNADISNPSRPFPVAQHWAGALMQEWIAQAKLEEHYSLQQSVQTSDDPLTGAKSQIFFITTFAKPLLDLTVKAAPELAKYAQHCDMNLERWITCQAELESQNSTIAQGPSPPPTSPRQPSDFQTAFPLTLPQGPSIIFPTPSTTTSIAGSIASSDSNPASPCESVSPSIFSPISDASSVQFNQLIFQHQPTPPTSGSSTGTNGHSVNGAGAMAEGARGRLGIPNANYPPQDSSHEAIRAAGKLSIRQVRKLNRNSWCATSTLFSTYAAANTIAGGSSYSPTLSTTTSQSVSPHDTPAPPSSAPSHLQVNGAMQQKSVLGPLSMTNGTSGDGGLANSNGSLKKPSTLSASTVISGETIVLTKVHTQPLMS